MRARIADDLRDHGLTLLTETLAKRAYGAIGCTSLDMRGSEMAEVRRMVAEEVRRYRAQVGAR